MSTGLTISNKIKETVASSVYDNPVVIKEFRTRMRGWKAFMIMGIYILLLSVVLFINYLSIAETSAFTHSGRMPLGNLRVGARMFATLIWTQVTLLIFILPALTSSSITHELERKTIEMLALTRLSAGKIIIGKHFSGFLYALMLLACSVPLASMCLMFGGLSPAEVAVSYALLATFSFMMTAVGVYWSSIFKNSASAGVCTYGISLGFMFITSALASFFYIRSAMGAGAISPGQTIFSLALMNPGYSTMGMGLANTRVCGLVFPAALASLGLQLAIGTLLLLIATTHVRYRTAEKALPIRLLLILTLSAFVWLTVGSLGPMLSPGSSNDWTGVLAVTSTILLIICGLMASIFSTGPVRNGKASMFLYALSGRKIFKSDIGGAITYTVLLTACVYGTLGATFYWLSKSAGSKLHPDFLPAYFGIGAAMVMMVVAMAAFGLLSSTIIKQRNGATALVILFGILLFAGYGIMLIYHQVGQGTGSSPIWQLAAFWPMTAIMGTIGEWDSSLPQLWWTPESSWRIVFCAYAVLTLAILSLAGLARRSSSGVQEEA